MATTIKLKHSVTPNQRPTSLQTGEIALNTADGKIFYGDAAQAVQEFVTGSSGSSTLSGLGDVSIGAHVDGQSLVYDSTQSKWVARTVVGEVGPAGPAGPRGPEGPAGAAGADGAAGAQGPAGGVGPAGPAGGVGPAGPAGEKGADGAPGEQGPAGPAGPKGDDGKGFKITKTYQTKADLDADTNPTGIEIGDFALVLGADDEDPDHGHLYVWNGTSYTFTIDMTGAKGIQGERGEQGPAGPAGERGPAGPAGEKGADGAAGEKGADGAPGAQGPVGPAGGTGAAGPAGERGPEGPEGAAGPAGAKGDTGPTLYEKAIEDGTFSGTEEAYINSRLDIWLATSTITFDGGTF